MKKIIISTNNQTELSNCSFVKTILMLLVVIYHCILYWNGNWFVGQPVYVSKVLAVTAQWFNTFHIYGFALVSGYLFYYLKHEKGRYERFWPFIINKTKRLLVPYAFISVVWAIPFAIYFYNYSFKEVFINYALGTSPSQLWFLLMLFWVFVIFYPLSGFLKNRNFVGVIVVLFLYGLGILASTILPNAFQILRAFTYLPVFFVGFKLRQFSSYYLRKIPIMVWVVSDLVLFFLYRLITEMDGIVFSLLKYAVSFALNIIGALMAFVVLQRIADRVKWKENKIFNIITEKSMPIYLFHQQVIYITIVMFNGSVNPYIHSIINFVVAMIVSILISLSLMRYKVTRFLIGEK